MTGFVYLASPYSHADAQVQHDRFDAVVREAAQMIKEGHKVFSPISHTHHIGLVAPNIDHDGWLEQDIAILRHAAALVVLMLPGWRESKGVAREIAFAREAGIPIKYRNLTYAHPVSVGAAFRPTPSEVHPGKYEDMH